MSATRLRVGDFGDAVAQLQDRLRQEGHSISADEQKRKFFGPTTREAVGKFQATHGLDPTCDVCEKTAASLSPGSQAAVSETAAAEATNRVSDERAVGKARGEAGGLAVPANGAVGVGAGGSMPPSPLSGGATKAQVSGTIALEHGSPASQVKVRLYQRGFGGTKTLLGEGQTDALGAYALLYTAVGTANIELYALGPDGSEVQLSRTKFGAQAEERLDLVAPSKLQPAAPEFSRLKLAVAPYTGDNPAALRDAVERGDRRDFSDLSSTTGWDPGALALAAEAFAGEARTKIPADGFYALARAGLPTDVRLLSSVPKATVESALRQAAEAGIVEANMVDKSLQAFGEFATEYRFTNSIRGAPSSPKEFVGKARISDADRTLFAKVIRDEGTGDVWERAKASGVSDAGVQKLQLQGKLAYLTFNNVDLADHLATKVTSNPLSLIDLGYYEASKWQGTLDELAGTDSGKLATLVPAAFSGRTIDERVSAYTTELARRVRQMDPHAVTVDRIATGKVEGVSERDGVATFLRNATASGFRLGKTPLGAFVAKSDGAVWNGIPAEKKEDVLGSVRTLSALYATSPTDEALSGLLLAGFKSATSIARLDYEVFADIMSTFLPGPKIGDQDTVSKVFWKAQQQSATVFNVFDGLKRLNTVGYAPGSTPGDAKQRDDQIVKTREKLAGMFPTLETLFGSVDYCECNQCQSVLSPAAYLVDLLHFIDPNEDAWASVKAAYKQRTGASYTKRKPFDVLNDRRPDLKNIALTCENTNTALPYIDIVNEVLEQLMMSEGASPAIEAYDVGEASSQDLLAEPQNILWAAYVGASGKPGLRDLVYPLALPFDLPLEMVRAFLKQLELPLWRLREVLGRPRTLDPSANGRADGWTDVWFERLGLGANDVSVITRSGPWYELYGYANESAALKVDTLNGVTRPALTSLRNGKTLARSLGVTYVELVELLRTRFINPEIENLIALKRLELDPNTVDRYLGEGAALSASEKTAFEADLSARGLKPSDLAFLRSEAVQKVTLVLRSPSVGCDFSRTSLAFEREPPDADQAMALVLRKMNAFVRLQRKLGWDIHELDRVLVAVTPGLVGLTLTTWSAAMKSSLIYLAHIEELRAALQEEVSREEVTVFWSNIPTVGISCLYERLFLSSGAAGRDPVFEKHLGRVLEDNSVLLNDHADAVRQAFQLSHDAIEPILVAGSATNRVLSIENLSILMRYSVLAKGLGVSIADLLTLLGASDCKPFAVLDAAPLAALDKDVPWNETLAFVREVGLGVEAGIDVAFIERICRHRGVVEQPAADKDPALLALAALPPADPAIPEKRESLIVQTLASQLSAPTPVVEQLLGNLLKDAASKPLKAAGFADAPGAAQSLLKLRKALDLVQSLGITEGELQYLTSLPGAFDLNNLPVTEVVDDAKARALRKRLGAWLELAAARKQFGRSERLLAVLIAARQPLDAANTASLREKQLQDAMTALTGLKGPGLAASLEALGAKFSGGASFEIPVLAEPPSLRKAIEALQGFTRLGLQPKDVLQIATASINEASAQRLRASLKGRYSPSAWRRLAKPIFDGLRQKQRDALVARLIHVMDGDKPRYGETPERLFEYLLLDPGMEPVVVASRIQLAIASVQLFVQRCLMNLEPEGVDPQIIDSKRWDWMRRFRVSEVNRKMFIWPENWLDPEFRDDKTHLFRNLEGALLQGDVNDDLVRTAFYTYLKGLEEIARLEMLTMYFEAGASADGSIVHVVGRTPNAPHKYFYRKSSHGMWTPWEPIDVGIEGEHLVLTAWRGRMHLFWVSFLEQSKEGTVPKTFTPGTDTVSTEGLRGVPQVKLQLHWIEQAQGKWSNRCSIPTFVDTEFSGFKATTDQEKRCFFVRAVTIGHGEGVDDDDLEVQITQQDVAHRFVFFSKLAPPRSESKGQAATQPPFKLVDEINAQATKWRGDGALQVKFVSAVTQNSETGTVETGGGYHRVLGGDKFALLFPSNETLPVPARTPPAGVGRPAGYVFRPQDAQHVAYRSGDGSIHDLFGTTNGWFYQSASSDAASAGAAEDVEPASSDPHGYPVDERGTICIAYAGSTQVYELVWSQLDADLDDPENMGTGWRVETLYKATGALDQPQGRPFGGLFLPSRGVVFRTKDGGLRAAVEGAAGSPWEIRDLNAALPKAASEPTGLLMTKTALGVTSVTSRHIFYLGVDGNVHELRSDLAGQNWTYTNITQGIAGAVKPAAGSTPAAYAFLAQNTLHVVYRGTDDRIHELWGAPGTWNYNAIGASFTKAKGDPAGYVTEFHSVQHVVYRGDADELVELWWNGAWHENVLTKTVAGAQKPTSGVAGYSFESNASQHVVSFADDGSPRELAWRAYEWKTGAYELTNPFPDDLGPLASPFFYESLAKDHAFFVEPYVVETAVHEWTEWIVTTREFVETRLGKTKLTPHIPNAIAVHPSKEGIIKRPSRIKEKIFGEDVIIRTPKGVISPNFDTNRDVTRGGLVAIARAPKIVDVARGQEPGVERASVNARLKGFQ
jgi:peptidoglycan hydrolase-like protein with peptidoglycan-binding domain